MSVSKRITKISSLLAKSLITPVAVGSTFTAGYLNPYRTGDQRDPSVGATALSYGVPLGAVSAVAAGHTVNKLMDRVIATSPASVRAGQFVTRGNFIPLTKGLGRLAAGSAGVAAFGAALGSAAKGARLRREDEWASLARDKDRVEGSVQAQSPEVSLSR